MPSDVDMLRIELLGRVGRGLADGDYTIHGIDVDVETSPCSFMYLGYGLQVRVVAPDGRSELFCLDRQVDPHKATRDALQKLVESQSERRECPTCARPFLMTTRKKVGTHLCKTCLMEQFDREYEAELEKDREAERQQDAQKKAEGFTHKATGWVHGGGDDRELVFYYKGKPTRAELNRTFRGVDYVVAVL